MDLKKRLGSYLTQTVDGETYKSYLPAPLPPKPPLDLTLLAPYLEQATLAIAELNSMAQIVPNKSLFIYMNVRKEALLSSQIEGTQSSFADLILFESEQKPDVSPDDVEEVSHNVRALNFGLEKIKSGFPLSLRLLKEVHAVLLSGGRGQHKLPGEFRKSQNWIGGSRPGNALFVPPPADHLMHVLGEFEKFLHDDSHKLPILVKVGLAHVQFETIHPFLDGNGRLGRLLIVLQLCTAGILTEPLLYISLYLKENRNLYYNLLQEVRLHGTWETWLEFFLQGITHSARSALATIKKINLLFEHDTNKIMQTGRAKESCEKVFELFKKIPQLTVSVVVKELNLSLPTARATLARLEALDIAKETSGKKHNKVYVYHAYLALLEEDAAPL